jgi:nucleoid-associated protein YgaU
VGVWIVTYWLWPAGGEPLGAPITFDSAPAAGLDGAAPPAPEVIDPLQADAGAGAPQTEPPAGEPAEQGSAAPQSREPVRVAPQFKEYIVERGDTIGSIARKVYGDEGLAVVVAQANPLTDPARLKAGQRLRVPVDPNNIQGRLMDPVTGEFLPVEEDRALPGRITEYVVERNDTLGGIAKALYGRATLWPLILDANSHVIKRPDDIRPGMRLIIPPAPQGASPR